jgi:hypothetical protein
VQILQEVDERKEVFSKRNNSLVLGACKLDLVAFEVLDVAVRKVFILDGG